MFWSLLLEPGKRYTKVVDNPFHISAAVLDTSSQNEGIVSVLVDIGDTEALIANLSMKHGILQFPLDLQFDSGSRISFYTTGAKANVHLSGFVTHDEDAFLEDESSDEEELPTLVSTSPPGKRKPEETPSPAKKKPKVQKVAPSSPKKTVTPESKDRASEKKTKTMISKMDETMDFDDEDDDEDEDEIDEEGEVEEEEEDSEDEEGEEEEEEDDEDEEDEEEGEEDEEDPDEDIEAQFRKIFNEKLKDKTLSNAVAYKPGKKTPFPTKEPVDIFKMEKTQKGAKTPVNEGAKTTKGSKTPKGGINIGTENAKTSGTEKITKTPNKPAASATPTQNGKTPKSENTVKPQGKSPQTPKTVKTGGVVCEDLVVGKGPEAKNGKMVSVYYEGRLVSNKKMFDRCDSGKPFKFRLGGGEVIKGWDVGVGGMKVGGRRKITCPAHMGYGKKGAPPDIPGNAALTFVVELKGIN